MDLIKTNYSSSDSDSDSDTDNELERQLHPAPSLPRLPTAILHKYHIEPHRAKYTTNMSVSSKINPNVKNWCTFLYYEWRPNRIERNILAKMVSQFNERCDSNNIGVTKRIHFEPLHLSSLGSPLPLHISLSQNIHFTRESDRNAFYVSLSKRIQQSENLFPFTMKFQPIFSILPSFLKESLFLTLAVDPAIKRNEIGYTHSIIQESLKEIFPQKNQSEIESMSCNPSMVHMSIGQALNVPDDIMNNWNMLSAQLPMSYEGQSFEFELLSLKFDKNRQILSIPL